ncbi:hypothetical protein WP1_309 [Pseudomonas phage WP1]
MADMITESAMFGDLILRFSRISFLDSTLNRPFMSKSLRGEESSIH